MKINKIGVLSLGKIVGFIMGFFGLLIGLVILVLSILGVNLIQLGTAVPLILVGIFVVVVLPLFYGTCGFIFGVITASIFNLATVWMGALELEMK